MKKTLVLASLLAAFGAASAQSSVTLYGWVDASLNSTTTGLGAAKLTQLSLDSGNVNGSRIGFRGTEALGNGLTANFVIETGFNVDTGSTAAAVAPALTQYIGNRQTFLSLSSAAAGTLALGRQYSTYDSARGGMSPMGHTVYDSTAAWGNGRAYTFRVNNAIRYDSANYGGFTFGATYGLGEDKTATASASKISSFGVGYAAGPVAARLAVQSESGTGSNYANLGGGVGIPAGATKEAHTLLAASYNFGVAKVTAEYNTSSDNAVGSTKEKEMNFGVNIPFGAASVDLGYGTSKQVGSHKATAVGVHVNYSLSPRTHAYVGLLSHKVDTNPAVGASVAAAKTSKFGVGIRHAF